MIQKIIDKIKPQYIILGLILLFFVKHLIPVNGDFIGGIDIGNYFWWSESFIKEQFLSGSIPLWNPYYYSGHPFLADPSTYIFYPSTLLYVFLPLSWAFNLDAIIHIYLAAMGSYYFVYLLSKSKKAGLASAIIFSLNGYFMNRIFAGHVTLVHAAAALPWVFYFAEKAYIKQTAISFLVVGLVLGLQILSGDPQVSFYTSFFVSLYLFCRIVFSTSSNRKISFSRYSIYYLLIPLISFCISSIQLLPTVELASLSERANNSYEFATFMSFSPGNFLTFLIAKPNTSLINTNWELCGYLGVLSIITAGVGCFYYKKRQQILVLVVMLIVSIIFILGSYTPIYKLFFNYLPFLSTFRVPARCLFIVDFIVSVLSGFGIYVLCHTTISKKQFITIIGAIIFLFVGMMWGAYLFQVSFSSNEFMLSVGLFFTALFSIVMVRFIKNPNLIAILLIFVLFTDLYLINSPLIPVMNEIKLLEKSKAEVFLEKQSASELYRVNMPSLASRGMKFHYNGINGYAPIVMDNYFKFIYSMANLPEPQFIRHTFKPELFQKNIAFSSKILGVKYAVAYTSAGYQLYENYEVMPRAVLVRDAIQLPKLEDHLAFIKKPDFNPEKQVLLLKDECDKSNFILNKNGISENSDSVKIIDYIPNQIKLKSSSSTNNYLVLSELYYPGWNAYVDGVKVPIQRANYLLRAIPLKSGNHNITFIYSPMSFWLGASVSGLTLAFIGVLFFMKRKKNIIIAANNS